MTRDRVASAVALLVGLFLFALGVWALVGPESFFRNLALFEPYNRHLFHDVGAFQMGLGATLLFALLWSDSLLVALSGIGVACVAHAYSHWIDRNLGGKKSDPYLLSLLAVVVVVAALLRYRTKGANRAS